MKAEQEHTRFTRATRADYPDIISLQRNRPLAGSVRLSLVSQPNFGEPSALLPRSATFVARAGKNDGVVGMGARIVQCRFWHNEPRLIGYLSQLRTVSAAYGLRRLLRGFRAIEATRESDELDFDITTIADDNRPARRLLERGLPGLPRYQPLCRLETLIFRSGDNDAATPGVRRLEQSEWPTARRFLYETFRTRPLAPAWHLQHSLTQLPGMHADRMWIACDQDVISGAAILWDQRPQRELLVHGYAPWLGRTRWLANLMQSIAGRPRLPTPGSSLALAHIACLAVDPDDDRTMLKLIHAIRVAARQRGIDLLAFTLPTNHPNLKAIRKHCRARAYHSTCYSVHWKESSALHIVPRGIPYIEAALL